MAKNVLDGKVGLVLNLESDGTDTQTGRVFQASVLFGKFGQGNWSDKTWRIQDVPIPNRFLSLVADGEAADFPQEDIVPAEEAFGNIAKFVSMADVVVVWHQGFHAHILATELHRLEIEFPEVHICDAQFIFKSAYRYQSGLKKNLKSAVDLYGASMSDFGSAGSPSRKVFAISWVLDRLLEDDKADGFLNVKDLGAMTHKLAVAAATDHIGFKQWLEKEGKDTSDVTYRPWPPAPGSVEQFDVSKAPFSEYPEFDVFFDEVTEPLEAPPIVPVKFNFGPIHTYMMNGLGANYAEQAPVEFELDGETIFLMAGLEDESFKVYLEAPKDSMKSALKKVETWPVVIKGHPDAKFTIVETIQGDYDSNNIVYMTLEAE